MRLSRQGGVVTIIPGETTEITHNLNTINIVVALYNVATGNELNSGITIVNENIVRITTACGAPEQIRVVIIGI